MFNNLSLNINSNNQSKIHTATSWVSICFLWHQLGPWFVYFILFCLYYLNDINEVYLVCIFIWELWAGQLTGIHIGKDCVKIFSGMLLLRYLKINFLFVDSGHKAEVNQNRFLLLLHHLLLFFFIIIIVECYSASTKWCQGTNTGTKHNIPIMTPSIIRIDHALQY